MTTPDANYVGVKVTPKGVFKPVPYQGGHLRDDDEPTPTPEQLAVDPNQPTQPTPGRVSDGNLSPEEATFKKRYGDLRAEFNRKTSESQREIDDLKRRLDQLAATAAPESMPKTPEQLAAWMKEYPELASAVRALARSEVEDEVRVFKQKLTSLDERERELKRQSAAIRLRERHSDIDELRQSAEFHEWAKTKSKIVQEALYGDDDDPDAAADAIDLYKSEKGLNKKKRSAQPSNLEASFDVAAPASTPEPIGSKGRKWKESEVRDLSDKDYEKYEDEITQAMRDDRFIYDLSREE